MILSLRKVTYLKIGYFVPILLLLISLIFEEKRNLYGNTLIFSMIILLLSLPSGFILIFMIELNFIPPIEGWHPDFLSYSNAETVQVIAYSIFLTILGYFQWFVIVPKLYRLVRNALF